MARTASPMTVAIRELCVETKGQITHAEARPRLQKLGHTVVPEPGPKSEDYKKWLAVVGDRPKLPKGDAEKQLAFYKKTCKEAKVANVEAIMKEDKVHREFVAERNSFDVTKYLCMKNGGSKSVKPETSKNSKAKIASTAKVVPRAKYGPEATVKRGRPAKSATTSSMTQLEAVQCVLEAGGADAVQKRINELNAEVAKLTGALQQAANVNKMLVA